MGGKNEMTTQGTIPFQDGSPPGGPFWGGAPSHGKVNVMRLLCMVREKNTQGMHGSIRWNLVANMCHFNLSEHYIVGPTRQSSSFSWKIGRKTRNGLTLDNNTAQYTWLWITYPAPPSVKCVVQPDLEYSHEETDTQILSNTRILLHAKHASTKVTYYCTQLTLMSLPWLCIHVQNTEIQPISLHQCYIHIMLSGSSSMFWPPRYSMHLFSGCDSTSRFLSHAKKLLGIFQRKCHISLCHDNPWRWVYYVWYNVSWLEKYRYSKTTHNSATLMRCETTHGIM